MATSEQDSAQTRSEEVAGWIKEIDACREREKRFRTTGKRVLDIYDGGAPSEQSPDGKSGHSVPFNILFSNTETLLPALYSAIPRPVVERRFKDEDPLGKAAAQAGQRVLEFLIDTNVEGYETFDEAMNLDTLTALLPGRSVSQLVYDADLGESEAPETVAPAPEAEEEQAEGESAESPAMRSELICLRVKRWDRVYYGYAATWSQVPWIAYEEFIEKAEAERLFGADMAGKITYQKDEVKTDDKKTSRTDEDKHQGERKTARIYQIWDKEGGKKIRYVSDQYKDDYLAVKDDPLGLTGFYNCPKPLQFILKPQSRTPTAPYALYEEQARELNELTRRIRMLARAIKAKGIYDSELGEDLKKLMDADDNELVPADKSSSLAAEKGLQNSIWMMPIEALITTLTQLYQAREQCKQVIYEITGISDILRGASKASETLGAQQIKTQWGTLRLKRAQKEVMRYCRDILRIMLELAASKFSEETWAKMTGLPFLLSTQYNELTAVAQALQQEVARIQATQPPPQPQSPGPPPIPPQVQQLQQIQQQLKAPQWSQVLALLKNDLQRAYRIDIETNSTVEPEAAEDQKNISDVLMALGQVLNGIGPLVVNGTLPFEAAQIMLLTIVRRFRFGSDLEDTIKAMKPPKQEDDGKAAEAQQMQAQMAQMQVQQKQEQAASAMKDQQQQAAQAHAAKEQDLAMRELKLKQGEENLGHMQTVAQAQQSMKEQLHAAKLSPEAMEMQRRQAQSDRATAEMKARIDQETELEKARIAASAQIEVARINAEAQKHKPEPVAA